MNIVESDKSCDTCICRFCNRNSDVQFNNKEKEIDYECDTCILCCIGDWYPTNKKDCEICILDNE